MTRDEIRTLLAHAAATTRDWAPTTVDVDVWQKLLADQPYDDAAHALFDHARRTHHRPVPADLIAGIKRIRADRLERAPLAVPAADPDNVQAYLDDLRTDRHRNAGTLPGPQPKQLLAAFHGVPPASPAAIQAARAAIPPRRSGPSEPTAEGAGTPRARESWPCCEHCTGIHDDIGHPIRHRLPCPSCTSDTPPSPVTLDAEQHAGAP